MVKGKKKLRREMEIGLASIREELAAAIERGDGFTMTLTASTLDAGADQFGFPSLVRGSETTIAIVYGPQSGQGGGR